MEKEIYNARITGTKLGIEDRGYLTLWLFVEWFTAYGELGIESNSCCGFGGCSIGGIETHYDSEKDVEMKVYHNFEFTSELILKILEVVGVPKWEDLNGKLIRIRTNGKTGCAGGIEAIGNIMKNEWFSIEEFYNSKGVY